MSRRRPHKPKGRGGAPPPPKSKKRKSIGIGFAPWFGLVGMLVGMVLGLRLGRTLVPMQAGGLLGVLTGAVIDWIRKIRP